VIDVSGPAGARIERLNVVEGQTVARGATVAELAGRDVLEAEKTEIEAQLGEAQQRLFASRPTPGLP
jgi:multidrug efflux pump subunit AcrA (membrane-fusion protein)